MADTIRLDSTCRIIWGTISNGIQMTKTNTAKMTMISTISLFASLFTPTTKPAKSAETSVKESGNSGYSKFNEHN